MEIRICDPVAVEGSERRTWPQSVDREMPVSLKCTLTSDDNAPAGFAEAAARHDYVNGCKTSPVLFPEGIYVMPAVRRTGIASALCAAIGQWGFTHGCVEFASDTQVDNFQAQALHRAPGFEETERVVFFLKRLICWFGLWMQQAPAE